MAIIKWEPYRRTLSPFGNWFDMTSRMNQVLDNIFGEDDGDKTVWGPSVDVVENDDSYQIMAELPGIKMEDLNINLADNVLTVKGEKKREVSEEKKANYYWTECCYGQFQRSFTLPSSVDAEKVKANLDNGVLTITLPKAEQAKAREIPIKTR
jgi:HSP20 family protein